MNGPPNGSGNAATDSGSMRLGSWEIFSDLAVLAGIFSSVVIVGGHLYLKTYYGHFSSSLAVKHWSFVDAATVFMDSVILASWFMTGITFLALIGLGLLFYYVRTQWTGFAGFASLFSFLIVLLLAAMLLSVSFADKHAARDWSKNETTLESVTVGHSNKDHLDIELQNQLAGELYFLAIVDGFVYLIKPAAGSQSSGSALPVYQLQVSDIIDLKTNRSP